MKANIAVMYRGASAPITQYQSQFIPSVGDYLITDISLTLVVINRIFTGVTGDDSVILIVKNKKYI